MYLERLSVDGLNTSQYYVPNGKFNTASPYSDVNLPNCTMYCYCRGYEAMEATKAFAWVRSSGGFGNAKEWFATTTLPKGYELRDHSIAVFDGNFGHVAFIERRIDSTHALITESNYDSNKSLRNWKYWQKRVVELIVGKATLSGIGNLIGFIYLPVNDKRVLRDTSLNQIQITEEFVNVRKSANGERYQGLFCPQGIYNVLAFKDAGNYKWAKLDTDSWVAIWDNINNCKVSWATIYEIEEDKTIKELKAQIKELSTENKALTNKLNDVKRQLNEIEKSI